MSYFSMDKLRLVVLFAGNKDIMGRINERHYAHGNSGNR